MNACCDTSNYSLWVISIATSIYTLVWAEANEESDEAPVTEHAREVDQPSDCWEPQPSSLI